MVQGLQGNQTLGSYDLASFTELSLFSGAGGGLLGTTHLLGWRTVCYVEWDKYAVEVLKARIRDGYLHDAPIWDDAFTFDGRPWAGLVDVVTAGFPCQPFSVAGKGLAENDPRNGFPAVIRILREVRPRIALLENVPGLISKPYFTTVCGELSEAGYDIEWDCISAASIGANHKRDRLWILATNTDCGNGSAKQKSEHTRTEEPFRSGANKLERWRALDISDTDSFRWMEGEPEINTTENWFSSLAGSSISSKDVSDTTFKGLEGAESARSTRTDGRPAERSERDWWAVEPELGRVADGVPHRVDRLRAIGNGQVPAVVREAWRRLSK